MTTTQNPSWLARLFQAVIHFFSYASPAVHDITIIADRVANAVKSSPITSILETALETAIPASTGLVEAFKLELPNIVMKLNWAVREEGQPLDQVVADGVAYLQSIKGTDQYVIELHGFAATVQKWFSDNLGLGLTIQQALLTPQIVHNPALLGVANDIIGDIETFSTGVDDVVNATATPPAATEQETAETPTEDVPTEEAPVDHDMQISNEAAANLAGDTAETVEVEAIPNGATAPQTADIPKKSSPSA